MLAVVSVSRTTAITGDRIAGSVDASISRITNTGAGLTSAVATVVVGGTSWVNYIANMI